MKHLSIKVSLMILAFFGSVSVCFSSDLSDCPSSGYKHNCFGKGTYKYKDQSNGSGSASYLGEWKNNKPHGHGSLKWEKKQKYVGEFKNGIADGVGSRTYEGGDKYVGEFNNSGRNGQEVYYRSDGEVYEGVFKKENFKYAQKTPYSQSIEIVPLLQTEFKKLPQDQRKHLQSNLKGLGFYKSSIDGLYGKRRVKTESGVWAV